MYDPNTHLWKVLKVEGEKPDGRDGHSSCVKDNCMYIFGGFVQKTKRFSNDVHEFNFSTLTWTLIEPKVNQNKFEKKILILY